MFQSNPCISQPVSQIQRLYKSTGGIPRKSTKMKRIDAKASQEPKFLYNPALKQRKKKEKKKK